jgi:hypothetical protein
MTSVDRGGILMKTRHLAILLLTLVPILDAAPTIHADEPPDPPDHTDAIEPLPLERERKIGTYLPLVLK